MGNSLIAIFFQCEQVLLTTPRSSDEPAPAGNRCCVSPSPVVVRCPCWLLQLRIARWTPVLPRRNGCPPQSGAIDSFSNSASAWRTAISRIPSY